MYCDMHAHTFIQDEKLDLCQREALSVSDMIYEAARCRDENIDAFPNSRLFRFFLFSAQQDAWHDPCERSAQPDDESKICVNQMKEQKWSNNSSSHSLLEPLEALDGELSRGHNH